MNTIRAFIAFKVSDEVKDELFRIQEELKKTNPIKSTAFSDGVNWSNPAGFHVTVEFLGEIEQNRVEEIKNILIKLAPNYHPFSYWLDRIDTFPNKTNPRVINVRVEEEGRVGYSFQENLLKELRQIGLGQDEHPWKPHITLARNKNNEFIEGLDAVKLKKVVWRVDSVELIKSDLLPQGPEYMTLGIFFFKN